jgi:hypothetical protein
VTDSTAFARACPGEALHVHPARRPVAPAQTVDPQQAALLLGGRTPRATLGASRSPRLELTMLIPDRPLADADKRRPLAARPPIAQRRLRTRRYKADFDGVRRSSAGSKALFRSATHIASGLKPGSLLSISRANCTKLRSHHSTARAGFARGHTGHQTASRSKCVSPGLRRGNCSGQAGEPHQGRLEFTIDLVRGAGT